VGTALAITVGKAFMSLKFGTEGVELQDCMAWPAKLACVMARG
jgi:hypothetical protein